MRLRAQEIGEEATKKGEEIRDATGDKSKSGFDMSDC